jgi:hypothetical protein
MGDVALGEYGSRRVGEGSVGPYAAGDATAVVVGYGGEANGFTPVGLEPGRDRL